jgi:hypothetical protein
MSYFEEPNANAAHCDVIVYHRYRRAGFPGQSLTSEEERHYSDRVKWQVEVPRPLTCTVQVSIHTTKLRLTKNRNRVVGGVMLYPDWAHIPDSDSDARPWTITHAGRFHAAFVVRAIKPKEGS